MQAVEIGDVAEQMKAQAREQAAKVVARTRELAGQAKPRRGRPPKQEPTEATPPRKRRGPAVAKESAPVLALRAAVRDHEREIKRLLRALKAIGG